MRRIVITRARRFAEQCRRVGVRAASAFNNLQLGDSSLKIDLQTRSTRSFARVAGRGWIRLVSGADSVQVLVENG